jgi:hypothetical protein
VGSSFQFLTKCMLALFCALATNKSSKIRHHCPHPFPENILQVFLRSHSTWLFPPTLTIHGQGNGRSLKQY